MKVFTWIKAQSPITHLALVVLILVLVAAGVSCLWMPYPPSQADPMQLWSTPSLKHLLGTDGSGRDLFSRLLIGSRITIVVPLFTAGIALILGLSMAWISALGPHSLRQVSTVLIDILIAFPTLLIAIMLSAVYGSGIPVVVVALGIGYGVSLSRVVRGELSQSSKENYVLAARAVGLSKRKILLRHIFPGCAPTVITQTSLIMGLSVLAESSLSYLGFGARPQTPSWGRILAETQDILTISPLTVLWPGLAIIVVVASIFQVGDALRLTLNRQTNQHREASK